MDSLPPVLIFLIAAAVVPLLPARIRPWAFLVAPVFTLWHVWAVLEPGSETHMAWLGLDLVIMDVTALNLVWGTVFLIVGVLGGIFALHVNDRVQQGATLAYLGSVLGVVFAGDLLILIVFWEIMAVSSMLLIVNGGRANSKRAAMRYLFVHVVGGSLLLAGILWHLGETGGSFELAHFDESAAGWLMFAGAAVNAAVVPLHAWLPDAYPESSATGMVFLGAFTTKTAVFVMLTAFAGWEVLLWLGPFMAIYGGVYSLLQNDIRRVLAYHIISQVGFMITAIGVGTHGAEEAVADQAFTHVLWPMVMVMAAGAILHATGTTKLTELGGLAKSLRGVLVLYMIGAVSISLFPLLVGLGAAELYTEHATDIDRPWPLLALYVAAVATTLAVAVRLPYYAFFGERRSTVNVGSIPIAMYVAMGVGAALSVAVGLAPATTFDLLALDLHPHGFASANVVFGLQVFAFTVAAGWLALPYLPPRGELTVDTDFLYRKITTPVRLVIQQPLEWPFTQTSRGLNVVVRAATRISLDPETGWSRLLRWKASPDVAISLLGRPPLSAALAAIFVLFAVVVLVAEVTG
jgi:multicomponent Na+:H+ antiporter subunit D